MKTKQILASLFVITALFMAAQAPEKKATVRIKKVENINGVEKVTDTTYTTSDLSVINTGDGDVEIKEIMGKDGKIKKMVIVNSESANGKSGSKSTVVINSNGSAGSNAESFVINGGDEKSMDGKTVIIKKAHCGATKEEIDNIKEETRIVIIKEIKITDASSEETQQLEKSSGITDNKLNLEKMDFYPNPNNGKFNLRFNLKNKGTTDINVMNSEGKNIYSEKLSDFSGTYDKEIDISKNPKGVYFVRVAQGEHAQLKKIVLE